MNKWEDRIKRQIKLILTMTPEQRQEIAFYALVILIFLIWKGLYP